MALEVYAPASVTIDSGSPAAPQLVGTPVIFTATGSGGPTGAPYQYRFTLDGGTPTAWSPTATFTMDGTATAATHTIQFDVTTEA